MTVNAMSVAKQSASEVLGSGVKGGKEKPTRYLPPNWQTQPGVGQTEYDRRPVILTVGI